MDVRKEINFCRRVSLPVLGVVENMRLAVQIGIESSGGGRCFVSTFGSDHSFPLYLLFYSVLWPTCSSGWVSFFQESSMRLSLLYSCEIRHFSWV